MPTVTASTMIARISDADKVRRHKGLWISAEARIDDWAWWEEFGRVLAERLGGWPGEEPQFSERTREMGHPAEVRVSTGLPSHGSVRSQTGVD